LILDIDIAHQLANFNLYIVQQTEEDIGQQRKIPKKLP